MKHDHLFAALESMERALVAGDAEVFAEEMKKTLELFASTPDAGADERLKPMSDRCEALAMELREKIHNEVRGNGTSRRASAAYGSSGGGGR